MVALPLHPTSSQYRCPRCHALLYRRGQPFRYIIVMAVTTLALFVPLTFLPILDLDIMGLKAQSTLFEALWMVYKDGYYLIAFVSMMTGLLIPVIMMVLLLLMLVPLHFGYRPRGVALWFRLYEKMREWGMAEVYLIAVIVAIIKLLGMGTLHIGPGFVLFIFFFLTFYITTVWFNPEDIWYEDAMDY
ncbi:paraquat-inducible protein A [Hydrogenimonas urashimensis]|uniref:paraquat-inducible protein A n=1 Tax=Hydrogenimonas urashimensis TaxID=2740515 RepID=UPI001916116F|nr:paraquat-inducible protein A [Hydrogenimonas urashimensis]